MQASTASGSDFSLVFPLYILCTKKGGKLPNWRHFGVIATSKSFFEKKLPYLDFSHNFLQYIIWWLFPISRILGSKSTLLFVYSIKRQKMTKLTYFIDVIMTSKNNWVKKIIHFWIPRKFPTKSFLTIFSHISYFGPEIEKSVFLGVFPIFPL